MSVVNDRTGRHEDDFRYLMDRGEATVADAVAHAEEIIVEAMVSDGTTAACVRVLLDAIDRLSAGESVHGNDLVPSLKL